MDAEVDPVTCKVVPTTSTVIKSNTISNVPAVTVICPDAFVACIQLPKPSSWSTNSCVEPQMSMIPCMASLSALQFSV